ncbi:MAG: hypothetical protein AAF698_11735, partial [Pseudomonadota bacterium]
MQILPRNDATERFIATKVQTLLARTELLTRLTRKQLGLRPEDRPYAPSGAHFLATNRRLGEIRRRIARHAAPLRGRLGRAEPKTALLMLARTEREIDRARRTFGMLFEVFSQRGTGFAPALAAHDVIAADCYAAVSPVG